MTLPAAGFVAYVQAQRTPPGYNALLERFEHWLHQNVTQKQGFLQRVQAELRYRAGTIPWLADFQREIADYLIQEWHLTQYSATPMPQGLLDEFQNGFFWHQYVCKWLLLQTPLLDPPSAERKVNQDPSRWEGLTLELWGEISSGRNDLKAIRGVCTTGKAGFESSVSAISLGGEPYEQLPGRPRLSERFPKLRSLTGSQFLLPDPGALRGLQLTSLRWDQGSFNDDWMTALSAQGLPLERLHLGWCYGVSGVGIGALRTLRSVTLDNCNNVSDTGLAAVCGLPRLEILTVEFEQGNTLSGLDALALATRLQKLSLRRIKVKDAWLGKLVGLPLTSVHLEKCGYGFTDAGLEHLRGMPLTELSLIECNYVGGPAGLANLRGMPLTALNLYQCGRLTSASLAELGGMRALKTLNLGYFRGLSNAGLAQLRGAPLKDLRLRCCVGVTDDGVRSLIFDKPITRLDLAGCHDVTEGILPTLTALPLVALRLTEGVFSEPGLQALRQAVPSLTELEFEPPDQDEFFGVDMLSESDDD